MAGLRENAWWLRLENLRVAHSRKSVFGTSNPLEAHCRGEDGHLVSEMLANYTYFPVPDYFRTLGCVGKKHNVDLLSIAFSRLAGGSDRHFTIANFW